MTGRPGPVRRLRQPKLQALLRRPDHLEHRSWAQSLAVTWLVLEITDRSDRLGIATALQFLPMLILGAPAGVLADRLNNRRLLLATSAASGVLALTFGIVVSTGHATIWWIYALTFLLGLVLAVERPTMQAILFQLVGRDLFPTLSPQTARSTRSRGSSGRRSPAG